MDIDLIFKIAAIGIIVAVLNQLLIRSGREDQAMMTTLAGLVVVLSILVKHGFRNAAIPVVSIAAVQLGFMLGGSVVIETVFALHGVGFLAWESISKNDFPVVQAVVLVLAVIYVGLTLLSDMLNAVLDPRLRVA